MGRRGADASIRPTATGTALFLVTPGVVTVSSEAIRDASTAIPWVHVIQQGRVQRQNVELGIRGDGRTEILSGLQEGAEVVTGGAGALTQGDRVRARREGG